MTAGARHSRPGVWEDIDQRTPRRRSLSREAIVEVALGIVDAEGLDALSMRRIAQELNIGPASLYAHVSGKEQLVELLLDRIAADLVHPVPDPEHWQRQLKDFLRQSKNNMAAHNDLARASLAANIPTTPHRLDAAETVVALMRAGGLPDQVIAYGTDLLALYLVSSAYEASQRHGPGARPEPDDEAKLSEQYLDGIRGYFASLPPERYPLLLSMIGPMTRSVGDERFEFGLDVLLSGLIAQAGWTPAER
jgi:AcrR family transcriptional regulator